MFQQGYSALFFRGCRKGDVFIFATANDISKLPPEFLRKGRFDEIFFVDLPDSDSRKKIFEIHLTKRGKEISSFDIDSLAEITEGFSGAEIEKVITSGLYTAFSKGVGLATEILEGEINSTVPLSVSMAEKIRSIRQWAKERTLKAN